MIKSLELSIKCGLKINIMVFDPLKNELQEKYTDDTVRFSALNDIVKNG